MQLALYESETPTRLQPSPATARLKRQSGPILCSSCRGREARYGFRRDTDDPVVERPRPLCFDCFRTEMARRQEAARSVQVRLPLEQTLEALSLRRRRAQIAARHALDAQ